MITFFFMPKRAFFEMNVSDEEFLRQHFDTADTIIRRGTFDVKELPAPEQCEVLSVFINSRLNREALQPLAALRLIATRSTGYDHIDMDYCRSKGIVVSNVPVYGDNTVAEHTFALILALSRK